MARLHWIQIRAVCIQWLQTARGGRRGGGAAVLQAPAMQTHSGCTCKWSRQKASLTRRVGVAHLPSGEQEVEQLQATTVHIRHDMRHILAQSQRHYRLDGLTRSKPLPVFVRIVHELSEAGGSWKWGRFDHWWGDLPDRAEVEKEADLFAI